MLTKSETLHKVSGTHGLSKKKIRLPSFFQQVISRGLFRVWIPAQSSANAPGNSFVSDLELHRAMVQL